MKPFLLDGEPVGMQELIDAAKREGYVEDGFYRTSAAAAVLRDTGHTVETNKAPVDAD